jgi:hypothetical protein
MLDIDNIIKKIEENVKKGNIELFEENVHILVDIYKKNEEKMEYDEIAFYFNKIKSIVSNLEEQKKSLEDIILEQNDMFRANQTYVKF